MFSTHPSSLPFQFPVSFSKLKKWACKDKISMVVKCGQTPHIGDVKVATMLQINNLQHNLMCHPSTIWSMYNVQMIYNHIAYTTESCQTIQNSILVIHLQHTETTMFSGSPLDTSWNFGFGNLPHKRGTNTICSYALLLLVSISTGKLNTHEESKHRCHQIIGASSYNWKPQAEEALHQISCKHGNDIESRTCQAKCNASRPEWERILDLFLECDVLPHAHTPTPLPPLTGHVSVSSRAEFYIPRLTLVEGARPADNSSAPRQASAADGRESGTEAVATTRRCWWQMTVAATTTWMTIIPYSIIFLFVLGPQNLGTGPQLRFLLTVIVYLLTWWTALIYSKHCRISQKIAPISSKF